jgi:hypothetical protein
MVDNLKLGTKFETWHWIGQHVMREQMFSWCDVSHHKFIWCNTPHPQTFSATRNEARNEHHANELFVAMTYHTIKTLGMICR